MWQNRILQIVSVFLVSILLVFVMSFSLLCCDSSDDDDNNSNEEIGYTFAEQYGGIFDDAGQAVCIVDDGYVITGHTDSISWSDGEVFLLKINAKGEQIWLRKFGGVGRERAWCLLNTPDGGFLIGGEQAQSSSSDEDIWVIRTDSQGQELWHCNHGGSRRDVAIDMVLNNDNTILVCGYTESPQNSRGDILLVKISETGSVIWSRTIGGDYSDSANAIAITGSGDFVLAGTSYPSLSESAAGYVVKINAGGSLLWQKTFSLSGHVYLHSITPTENGFTVSGQTWVSEHGSYDALVAFLDNEGNLLSWQVFGMESRDELQAQCLTDDGGLVLFGSSYSPNNTSSDFWLVKLDTGGQLEWQKFLGSDDFDTGSDMKRGAGGFIMCGETMHSSTGSAYSDIFVIKSDLQGESSTGSRCLK